LASARSKREFKELAIQRNSIDALFFFGAPAFMKLFSGSTAPQLTRRSAGTYIASYLLSMASIAGIIVYTNALTLRSVKRDAATQAQGEWFKKLSQAAQGLNRPLTQPQHVV